MKIIDPHLHLFNLSAGQYHWLKANQPPFWPDKNVINKSFYESDLLLDSPLSLAGFVHIEAGFDNQSPWQEIDYLEQHCKLPYSSVAFADLTANDFSQTIDMLLRRDSVCGVRHILDDQAATLLANKKVRQNLQLLAYRNLSFDAQLPLTDRLAINHLTKILDNNPQLKVIINHAGWPPAEQQSELYSTWQNNLQQLAEYPNVAVKLSGWEMTNRHWRVADMLPILRLSLDILGEKRVMLASNFPLCLWRESYQQLWQDYTEKLPLTTEQLTLLSHDNAASWYNLKLS